MTHSPRSNPPDDARPPVDRGQWVDWETNVPGEPMTDRGQTEDLEPVLAEQVDPPPCPAESAAEGNCGELGGSGELGGWGELTVSGEPRSRWWTPLAVASISLAVFILTSGVMAIVALLLVHGSLGVEILQDPESLKAVSQSRLGLFLVIVIPQIALVIPCLIAAILSPVPIRQRLGLVQGRWPVWTWFAVAAATPLVGMVSGVTVDMFMDESDALKQMTEIFRRHGQSGFLFPLAMMIGATPAICEELLFRGYIQTRLTQSIGPLFGVLIASILFAAFHLDLVHVVAVFPLGLFLGWVSWQSGSLFPAMLGHFFNNVVSVVGVVMSPEETPDTLALPSAAFTLGILGVGIIGMAVVSIVSVAYRRSDAASLATSEAQLA